MKSLVVAFLASALAASFATADDDFDPEVIVEGRQAGLRDVGGAFKGIGDELKGSKPVAATIAMYARQIDDAARMQDTWFVPGTGPDDVDIDTMAKREIWSSPKEFKSAQDAFTAQAARMLQVASGGDIAAMRSQWRELGKTCKGCHDVFREEE